MRLSDSKNRFIAVVGASGSGKSSLVSAGLLPALEKSAIQGSQGWIRLRFTPGEFGTPGEVGGNPFMALAMALKPTLEKHGRLARDVAGDLKEGPDAFHELVAMVLEGKPEWTELLLFIDQFEELFTLVAPEYRRAFVNLLALAAKTARVRIVVTLRADFYHRCLEWSVMDELLA